MVALLLLLQLAAAACAAAASSGLCSTCACDSRARIVCACDGLHQNINIHQEQFETIPGATQLEIHNCSRASIESNALKGLRELKRVKLLNIANLELYENSLYWMPDLNYASEMLTGLRISIENTTIYHMPSHVIKGRIEEIIMDKLRIDILKSFAVSTLTDTKIVFVKNSIFRTVELQPFKNFHVDTFILKNNSFTDLPSRFLSDIGIDDLFSFESNRMHKMRSNCIISNGMKKVHIQDNDIGIIDSEAFNMKVNGDVLVYNNRFHEMKPKVFVSISITDEAKRRYDKRDFRFTNNTMTSMKLESLLLDDASFRLHIKEMYFNESCGCSNEKKIKYSETNDEVYCRYINGSFILMSKYAKSFCDNESFSIVILIIIIVFSLILIAAIVLSAIYLIRRYCKGGNSIFFVNKKPDVPDLPIIKPDGRTYKETELYVIVEKADLLTTDL